MACIDLYDRNACKDRLYIKFRMQYFIIEHIEQHQILVLIAGLNKAHASLHDLPELLLPAYTKSG